METKDTPNALDMSSATVPVIVALPGGDEPLAAAVPAETPDASRGSALGVAGWVSLLVNAANVVVTSVACYQLYEYLNAPHPKSDSYAIAGLYYLVLIPSLIESIAMALLIENVLHGEYCRDVKYHVVTGGLAGMGKGQQQWLMLLCVVMLLLSLWPTCVGLAILIPQLASDFSYYLSITSFAAVLWVAVTLSFATFSTVLFKRLLSCPRS